MLTYHGLTVRRQQLENEMAQLNAHPARYIVNAEGDNIRAMMNQAQIDLRRVREQIEDIDAARMRVSHRRVAAELLARMKRCETDKMRIYQDDIDALEYVLHGD